MKDDKKESLANKIFGKYEPPEWIKRVGFFFVNGFRKNSKIFKTILIVLLGIIVLGFIPLGIVNVINSKLNDFSKRNTSSNSEVSIKTLFVNYSCSNPSRRKVSGLDPEELIFFFDGSVCDLEKINSEITSNIIISPEIKGNWHWDSDQVLVFSPSEDWKIGTKYKCTFPKEELFADYIKTNYTYSFKTENFYAEVLNAEFVVDELDSSQKKAVFTFKANYPLDIEKAKKLVSVFPEKKSKEGYLEYKEYSYEIEKDSESNNFYIVTENLPVAAKTTELFLLIKKGLCSSDGGNSLEKIQTSVSIPGLTDFIKVESVDLSVVENDDFSCDQVLTINTKGKVNIEELYKNIEVYLLPTQKPAEAGLKSSEEIFNEYSDEDEIPNYNWLNYSEEEITENILALSKKISLTPLENENEFSSTNNFIYSAPDDRYLYVHINNGVQFYGNYNLYEDFNTINYIEKIKPEVSIVSEGTILSFSGSKRIPIYSRGINKLQYEISKINPTEVNDLISMSNGDMKQFSFKNKYLFNEENIAQTFKTVEDLQVQHNNELIYSSYNFTNDINAKNKDDCKTGLFLFNVSDYENKNICDKRLILITDLGIIVKSSCNDKKDIFIQSIQTGLPIENAKVSLISKNGSELLSAFTDSQGHVEYSSEIIKKYLKERGQYKPIAYVVKQNDDFSFMPFSETGRQLDYSDFKTDGIYGASDKDKIFAYMFSDRGIYRPGDNVNIGLIFKTGDWKTNIEKLPVEIAVEDPNGTEIFTKRFQINSNGFHEVNFLTQSYSPTGNYSVTSYIIRNNKKGKEERLYLNSEQIKVEEFLPDTLSVTTSFENVNSQLWLNSVNIKSKIRVNNLFGTPAVGNIVKSKIDLYPGLPEFTEYKDYTFFDSIENDNSYFETNDDVVTNENGEAELEFDLSKFEKASYKLILNVETLEKNSGRKVSKYDTIYVSPYEYFLGYKTDGSLTYLNRNEKRKVDFVVLNKQLEKIDLQNVKFLLEDKRYISALVKQSSGVYKYQSIQKKYTVNENIQSINRNKMEYFLPTEKEGEFVLSIIDDNNTVLNKIEFSVIGNENISRSLTRTAELEIKLDKDDLSNGENVNVFIKAPYAGSGLITIERDGVYNWKWFKTNNLSTVQSITIPNNLDGNGYVTVMFSRDSNSKEIFMSPFCYASVPFSINRESKTNKINLELPTKIKSGDDLEITYSTKENSKIIIYAVDEGILQVGNYQKPNPMEYFFAKRALEVQTAQLLDLVLPDYNVLKSLSAIGGGAQMDALAKNLNPFKRKQNIPVVFWSGILDSTNEKQTIKYHVPEYFNGKITAYAISVNANKIGVAQNSTIVQSPIILTTNVPMFATCSDEIETSVTVYNNIENSNDPEKIEIIATTSDGLTVLDTNKKEITLSKGKDEVVKFNVKVNDVLGNAEIKFEAISETEKVYSVSNLSIRPAMPYKVNLSTGYLKKENVEIDVDTKYYDELSKREISTSYLPLTLAKGLSVYLENYPYGCSEQITSASYVFLYPQLVNLMKYTKQQQDESINRTISILQSRLKQNGNIGMWTNKSIDNPYITIYCAQFLTEARNKGYYVPNNFFSSVLSALEDIAGGNKYSEDIFERAYATYVLTMNEIITTKYIESILDKIKTMNYSYDFPRMYLAASYKMLQKDKQAKEQMSLVKNNFDKSQKNMYNNSLNYASVYLSIMSKYFLDDLDKIASEQLLIIASCLKNNIYTTVSISNAISAIENYQKFLNNDDKINFTIEQIADSGKEKIIPQGKMLYENQFTENSSKIKISNNDSKYLFYQITQSGFEKNIPQKNITNNLEISREYCTLDGKPVTEINLGDSILVNINVRTLNSVSSVDNLAIVDMLPSGFEVDSNSIRNKKGNIWKPDYVDVREDRVVIFGSVNNNVSSYSYVVKAIAKGSFVVPPIYAEVMYDKTVNALQIHEVIKIK